MPMNVDEKILETGCGNDHPFARSLLVNVDDKILETGFRNDRPFARSLPVNVDEKILETGCGNDRYWGSEVCHDLGYGACPVWFSISARGLTD